MYSLLNMKKINTVQKKVPQNQQPLARYTHGSSFSLEEKQLSYSTQSTGATFKKCLVPMACDFSPTILLNPLMHKFYCLEVINLISNNCHFYNIIMKLNKTLFNNKDDYYNRLFRVHVSCGRVAS